MAVQTKWYTTPQAILLFFGLGLLLFISGFGIGKWYGSGSLRNQDEMVFAEFKVGEATHKIYGRDVLPKLDAKLRELEKEKYRLKRQLTEDLIFEKANLPSSGGTAVVSEAIPEAISEAELKKFAADRGLVISKLSPQSRRDLEGNYRIHKVQTGRRSALQSLLESSDTTWNIPLTYHRPKVEVGIGSFPPFKLGRGKGTLVVFGNYHCPNCSSLWTKLDSLNQENRRGANLYVRYRLLDGDSQIVRTSALGGFCASDQGQFASYHKAVVAAPPRELSEFHQIVEKLQIKREIFDTCIAAKSTEARLQRDLLDAVSVGIDSQALAVVNGIPIEAEEPIAEYVTLLGN